MPKKPAKIEGTNKYDIDPEKVETLASYFLSMREIAAFFAVDEGTIRKRFPQEIQKGREKGKGRLRQKQVEVALGGNTTMLIWLGKQYLGQADTPINTDPTEENGLTEYLKGFQGAVLT